MGEEKLLFSLENDYGANSVHRANFLDEMTKLVPEGVTHFKKHLDTIEQAAGEEKMKLRFHDGTTAEADAVSICDPDITCKSKEARSKVHRSLAATASKLAPEHGC